MELITLVSTQFFSSYLPKELFKGRKEKGGKPLPKAYGLGEDGGIRALMIIDYWSRGPKATIIFIPLPFLRILKDIESVSP